MIRKLSDSSTKISSEIESVSRQKQTLLQVFDEGILSRPRQCANTSLAMLFPEKVRWGYS